MGQKDAMERLKLIELNIGVTESGLYCTTYLTPTGSALVDDDPEFKKLLDAVASATAQALTDHAPFDGEKGMATASGPGGEALANAVRARGVDVEVIDEQTDDEFPNLLNIDLPIN